MTTASERARFILDEDRAAELIVEARLVIGLCATNGSLSALEHRITQEFAAVREEAEARGRAEERERCAKVAEEAAECWAEPAYHPPMQPSFDLCESACLEVAAAIRGGG